MNPATALSAGVVKSRRRQWLFRWLAGGLGLGLAGGITEGIFRLLEAREARQRQLTGAHWIQDPRWGWKPSPGEFNHRTAEFVAQGKINRHHMNDEREEAGSVQASQTRILVVGDSHTFAWGVSTTQTWVRQLEARLNAAGDGEGFRTYNSAVTGYSLHQYLCRLRDDGTRLQPHFVVVGLSYATDFYDLLPPGRGGWIYGYDWERDYFDFDDQGKLVARHWVPPDASAGAGSRPAPSIAAAIRRLLSRSATFRQLRRSKLMLMIGARVRVGGQSLWPNMEIVMEKEISPMHEYQHRLFRALLAGLKTEAERQGAKLIVVGIPYLPQVYDDLREATFPGEKYDVEATMRRVATYCREMGIGFVDAQTPMRTKHKQTGRWLHFPKDAHPTVEGHQVIAEAVLSSGLVQRALPPSQP